LIGCSSLKKGQVGFIKLVLFGEDEEEVLFVIVPVEPPSSSPRFSYRLSILQRRSLIKNEHFASVTSSLSSGKIRVSSLECLWETQHFSGSCFCAPIGGDHEDLRSICVVVVVLLV
jgi:hypothetical protein